ncbi:MAG: rRNA pseudouridine synthase [Clostridia bacterium]|nr:rRNA pseudouridine synthase [Clostridia bacterium]
MALEEKMRIQKYLSACGETSRRAAEKAVADGRVTVNGEVASVGCLVSRDDLVELDGRRVTPTETHRYILLFKPKGYVTTLSDRHAEHIVTELLDIPERVYPVGRLDRDSEGLIILTNDGEFAEKLAHPRYGKTKTYIVYCTGAGCDRAAEDIAAMRVLDGETIFPVKAKAIRKEAGSAVLELVLTEGKNRQIRRMCASLRLHVTRLVRTKIGPVSAGRMKGGDWRELTGKEVEMLYADN